MSDSDVLVATERMMVGHGHISVLEDLAISVRAGEVVAILGRNGVGKTTLLHTIVGLLPAIGGSLTVLGRQNQRPLFRLAREGVGFIPETRCVVNRLTVAENLKLGGGDSNIALELFPELRALMKRRAGLLSGGEQQMLAIGRTLSTLPRLLVIDELSLGLAPVAVRRLLEALKTFVQHQRAGILIVEQHLEAALNFADRGYVLAGGEIGMSGDTAWLRSKTTEIESLYLV